MIMWGDFTVKYRQLYYNLCSGRLRNGVHWKEMDDNFDSTPKMRKYEQYVEVFPKPGCSRESRKIPNESPFYAEFRGI